VTGHVRRAVVTGGAGFLGSWLCELLLAEGWRVLCVDNFLTGDADNVSHLSRNRSFTLVESDVSEEWDVPGPVDLVLHLASAASPISYLRHPVATMRAGSHGTFNAVELARRRGARFLLTSTSEVYGDPLELRSARPTGETSTPSGHAACTTSRSGSPRPSPTPTAGRASSMPAPSGSSTPTAPGWPSTTDAWCPHSWLRPSGADR
jgi:nucleoside-diphosphate-sugar epimerase